jgi:hypothetical protein
MRAFKAEPLKEHQALKPVKEACNERITKEKMPFSLKREPNGSRLCLCIRNMEENLQDHAMEPICNIITNQGEVINKLHEPGLVTEEIVDEWLEDPTIIGVWDPVTQARLPMCPYGYTNMIMSGREMMNSCTEGLQLLLKEGSKPKHMNGPKIFCTILQKVYHASISKTRKLKEELGALNLKKFQPRMRQCSVRQQCL